MKVLLAVDASPDSKNAAQMVRQFAEPATVDVLNVVDEDALKHAYISPEMPASYVESYRKEVSEAAERTLHEIKEQLTGVCPHIRLIADTGDAAESIVETAEETRPDVIVVGQRGMTATPSFLLGGVSQKVATYAPCSVLVVKEAVEKLERLVVAVDGSPNAQKTVKFLTRNPFKPPVDITIVTVWPQRHVEEAELIQRKGHELLEHMAKELQPRPYRVQTEMMTGDPAFMILEAAVRRSAQLILVGSRGMKAIKRFFLGSVSEKLLVHATCSVLIIR
jgi:nucleotide-binding universal stress UspA family protein